MSEKNKSAGVELGRYFKVPKGVFQSGLAARLGSSAMTVYVALCEHANRKNSNTFVASDKALAADSGVAERTIRGVRTKLVQAKLITIRRELGQSYTYTLLPISSDWVPIKERPRQPCKPRALYALESVSEKFQSVTEVQQILPLPPSLGDYSPFT
jgi:hypothetical protein